MWVKKEISATIITTVFNFIILSNCRPIEQIFYVFQFRHLSMLFSGETGMKHSLFPADSRVIFCQNSDVVTKMLLLPKCYF